MNLVAHTYHRQQGLRRSKEWSSSKRELVENPNITLPFCQFVLYDDGQPFSKMARLTISYTYDFIRIPSVHMQFSL